MDLERIIGDLIAERDRLSRIIKALETMERTGAAPKQVQSARRGRKSMDHAARQEVSARMKLYWAKRRVKVVDPGPGESGPENGASA